MSEPKMILKIEVTDLETGETETRELPAGEYYLICTAPCYLAHTNSYPTKGTHVLTVKGRISR